MFGPARVDARMRLLLSAMPHAATRATTKHSLPPLVDSSTSAHAHRAAPRPPATCASNTSRPVRGASAAAASRAAINMRASAELTSPPAALPDGPARLMNGCIRHPAWIKRSAMITV